MKLYEYIKGEEERTTKVLGYPIMVQTTDYMTSERYQSFMDGLITTKKVNNPYTEQSEKDIKFLGKSIIKRREEGNYRYYYIGGKLIRKVSLINEFKKGYFKYFDKKYDDIYILRANSGEIYLTLTYLINTLIKRNGSKNPLLLATQKYHVDMIKMLCPNIPYIYIGKLRLKIAEDEFKIDNFRFFMLFNNYHFKNVEINIKNKPIGETHYFKSIMERLNLKEQDLVFNKISVLPSDEQNMLKKVKELNLNLNKFVFLAPEAQSCKMYDEDFWCELINRFKDNGYDVFVNKVEDVLKLRGAIDYKTCYLTFGEAFALARKAKKIVSLRSGFTEFLLQTNVPMDVIYTKFRHRHFFDDMDIYHVMSGFGIIQIPFVDKKLIREFNMFETSQYESIKKITEDLN